MQRTVTIVDPALSKFRFEQGVTSILQSQDAYARMGIRVIDQDFPHLTVALKRKTTGTELLLRIGADNYDHQPPRGWWIDDRGMPLHPDKVPVGGGFQKPPNPYDEKKGWLCFPGWREYHDHPFHQGVNWHAVRDSAGYSLASTIVQLLYDLNDDGVRVP